ncbi:hypothetical protein P152DRAFT_482809 [Eremomyces bilateralis CBS 781.70]|uniref:Tubulin nucleotide-binding domain-like protein n=1 Tax=Eremomyces bilateralis CBS 781.70 TaxID=1392243 RepID=A0A6G1G1C3_9PEZI|nr:uncharacterized protein P152DRAFT_482809 [Eremomyces bilateralis CBS 781.70]KAF1811782.1 hypothetical protein P152DRAFT_482809 [Eremomyces bilateralis CBS 781.70]
MHEILTVQLGSASNHLGAHYWNTQESYFTYEANDGNEKPAVDHDISFRAGVGADGSDTYLPRALIYDLKDNFGSLKQVNALYEVENPSQAGNRLQLWHGSTATQSTAPSISPSPYSQALDQGTTTPSLLTDSTVRYWSDYLRVYFHPRTLHQITIPGFRGPNQSPGGRLPGLFSNSALGDLGRSTQEKTSLWSSGEDIWAELDSSPDGFEGEALRSFLEECDLPQGIQVFTSINDAWGNVSIKAVERIRDEIGSKTSLWLWGLEERIDATAAARTQSALNTARCMFEMGPHVSMFVPVSAQHAGFGIGLHPWRVAALEAAAIESFSLPTRLGERSSGQALMVDMETQLDWSGRRKAAKLAFSTHEGADITLWGDQIPLAVTARQRVGHKTEHVFGKVECIRGDWEDKTLDVANGHGNGNVVRHMSSVPFPILDSYPTIFEQELADQRSLAVKTSLSVTDEVATRLRSLSILARRAAELSERETLSNGLEGLREEYVEGWEADSDEDDD